VDYLTDSKTVTAFNTLYSFR